MDYQTAKKLKQEALDQSRDINSINSTCFYRLGISGKDNLVKWGKKHNLKFLGKGVYRAVFEVRRKNHPSGVAKGNVIKLPYNNSGARQNSYEGYLAEKLSNSRVVQCFRQFMYEGMLALECEKLKKVSNSDLYGNERDRAGDAEYEACKDLAQRLYLTDWLQIGYSEARDMWVLSDIADFA